MRLLAAAGAGALLAAGFPPYNVPVLLPLGVALLLLALNGETSVRRALYLGFACGAAYFGATLFWLTNLFGAAAVSLCAIAAAFPALFAAGFVWLRGRLPRFPVPLLAAVLWTGVEYFRSEPFPLNFGWIGLGYAVVDRPLLARLAPIFGGYGLTFGIVLVGGLIARLLERRGGLRFWGAVASTLACWLLLCLSPAGPQRPTPPPARPLAVRAVQAYCDDDEALLRLSSTAPGAAAAGKPFDVLLWPEYSLLRDPQHEPKLWDRLQSLARTNQAVFVFGAKDKTGLDPASEAAYRNTAFVLGPDGQELGRHVKNHLVHFVQDGEKGTRARAITSPAGRLGVAICFDMDYPDVARRLVQDGAEVFLVPNMDPAEWGPVQQAQHRQLFQMRAAENGRYLVRADVAGGTSACAPSGQEIARVSGPNEAVLDVVVGRETGRTLFVRGGWLFGRACLAAAVLLIAWAVAASARMKRRSAAGH